MILFKSELEVYCLDEFCSDYPNRAIINLSTNQIKRIFKLQRVVKKAGAMYISDWDVTPDWQRDGEDLNGCMDSVEMKVLEESVQWVSFLKHTDIEVETERLNLVVLREVYAVSRYPRNELPLHIATLKYPESKELLERRLKKVEQ